MTTTHGPPIQLRLLLAKMASSILKTEITDGKAFTKERRTLVIRTVLGMIDTPTTAGNRLRRALRRAEQDQKRQISVSKFEPTEKWERPDKTTKDQAKQ
eukprot:gene18386-5880_t